MIHERKKREAAELRLFQTMRTMAEDDQGRSFQHFKPEVYPTKVQGSGLEDLPVGSKIWDMFRCAVRVLMSSSSSSSCAQLLRSVSVFGAWFGVFSSVLRCRRLQSCSWELKANPPMHRRADALGWGLAHTVWMCGVGQGAPVGRLVQCMRQHGTD